MKVHTGVTSPSGGRQGDGLVAGGVREQGTVVGECHRADPVRRGHPANHGARTNVRRITWRPVASASAGRSFPSSGHRQFFDARHELAVGGAPGPDVGVVAARDQGRAVG